MLRNLIARWLDGWRHEPDPAMLDTDAPDDDGDLDDEPLPDDATPEQEADIAARYAARRRGQDRENALAAGLVMAGGLDGFEHVYAVQGMILAGMHHDAVRQAWGDKLN